MGQTAGTATRELPYIVALGCARRTGRTHQRAHTDNNASGARGLRSFLDQRAHVRHVVGARVGDPEIVDDLVQETLARVLAARGRLDAGALAP